MYEWKIGDVLDEEDVMRTRLFSRLHSSILLALVLAGLTIGTHAAGQAPQGPGRAGDDGARRAPAPETTAANATGEPPKSWDSSRRSKPPW